MIGETSTELLPIFRLCMDLAFVLVSSEKIRISIERSCRIEDVTSYVYRNRGQTKLFPLGYNYFVGDLMPAFWRRSPRPTVSLD